MANDEHLGSAALSRYQTSTGAEAYSGKFERSASRRRTSRREYAILEAFLKTIGAPGSSLLNMACGAGRFVEALRPKDRATVTYGDFSQDMLKEARRRLREHGCDHVEFRRLDATRDDPIEPHDLVFCCRMLHHFKDRDVQDHALDFLCGSASQWLIFTCASTATFKGWWRHVRTRMGRRAKGESLLSLTDLTQRLKERGFDVVERRFVDRLFSSQTWILARRR